MVTLVLIPCAASPGTAQGWPPDEQWYENPLGFEPLSLHTRNGFLLPAIAVGIGLLVTDIDSTTGESVWTADIGTAWGYKYPNTVLHQIAVGRMWQARTWLSVGVEGLFYLPRDGFNAPVGFGVRPFARFYPISTAGFRFYLESGGGLIWFTPYFPQPTDRDPRLGTPWNGTTKYGIGVEFEVGTLRIHGGIRHVHVSNGNTSGVGRNPSHDSNGPYIGVMLR